MTALQERLQAFVEGLAPRERLLLGGVGCLAAILFVWLAFVRPLRNWVSSAETRADTAETRLEVAAHLRRELDQVQGRLAAVEHRIQSGPAGNLFTTLESLARKSAVQVDKMEPQASQKSDDYRETKVQVVLKGVTLAQTVSYLRGIESAPQLLSVKSLRIRTRPDKPQLLDVTFTVSSFERS